MDDKSFEKLKQNHGSEEGVDFNLFTCKDYKLCEEIKTEVFKDEKVQTLINSIKKESKGEFLESNIKCLPCDNTMLGGYANSQLVILCQNRLQGKEEVKNTLIHELIHVYDFYRGKLNFDSCRDIVCSEIRAANLTEDCSLSNELKRFKFPVGNFKEKCVKRRSILSAQYTSACLTLARTELSYNEVFKACLLDSEPFNHPKNYNI